MLAGLVPGIQKNAELVQEISASSREQDSGANQINQAILQLDQSIQQNASLSEELAASSDEMSSQAEKLIEVIGFFKTGEEQSHRKQLPQPGRQTGTKPQNKPALKALTKKDTAAKPGKTVSETGITLPMGMGAKDMGPKDGGPKAKPAKDTGKQFPEMSLDSDFEEF